jgi:predicted HicB family RNase H-like nuclease
MTNTMAYKGYAARIEYDGEDEIFFGHLAGIRDIIGFHADNVADLKAAFREAVDDYIEACGKIGKEPECASSGELSFHVDRDLQT